MVYMGLSFVRACLACSQSDSYLFGVTLYGKRINISKYCNNFLLLFLLDFPLAFIGVGVGVVVSSFLHISIPVSVFFEALHVVMANRSIFKLRRISHRCRCTHVSFICVLGYRFHLPSLFHFAFNPFFPYLKFCLQHFATLQLADLD